MLAEENRDLIGKNIVLVYFMFQSIYVISKQLKKVGEKNRNYFVGG
jgi:hypothetical protein